MNCAIDPTAAKHQFVGSVHDCVRLNSCDVTAKNPDATHGTDDLSEPPNAAVERRRAAV